MWVKGSGSDLATATAADFVELQLDDVLLLFERDHMTDEKMVAYLARCQLDPAAPRSSIETLLHAFIPALHVHHTHPDAIDALACAVDGERLVRECFGGDAAWIPYIRPGFALAKQVGTEVQGNPHLRLVVLAKHGLVVWGESAEAAYRRTIEVINRAAEFVDVESGGTARFGGQALSSARLDDRGRELIARSILPVVRGAVSSQRAKVLLLGSSDSALELVSSRDASELVTVGAACPDHLVHTKRVPLWIPFDPDRDDLDLLASRVRDLAAGFRAEYAGYFERHADAEEVAADPDARVVLIQNVGLIGAGTSVKAARLSRDLYLRAIEVMAGAHAVGGSTSLTEAESFDVEYWPLELYKLSLAPPPRELDGKWRLSPVQREALGEPSSTRWPEPGPVFSRSMPTAMAPTTRSRRWAMRASPWPETSRQRRAYGTRSRQRSTHLAVSTSSYPVPELPLALRSRRPAWRTGSGSTPFSCAGTFWLPARRFRSYVRSKGAGQSSSSPRRTRWWRAGT